MDYEYKYKKKLFGNLNFIAFLVKSRMINQQVPFYVFDGLLDNATSGKGENKVNTYEGACKFLRQIGDSLDYMYSETPLTDKQKIAQAKFDKVIETLQRVSEDTTVENRTRIIIKNTLDLREVGWTSKNDKDQPKTQEQHKKDYHKEQNQQRYDAEESYNDRGSQKDNKPKGKPAPRTKVVEKSLTNSKFQALDTATADSSPDSSPIKRPVLSQSTSITDESVIKLDLTIEVNMTELKKSLIGNFKKYVSDNEIDYAQLQKLKKATEAFELIHVLINKFFDEPESELEKFIEYIKKLFAEKVFTSQDLSKGFYKIFQIIPDIESDFPHLPKTLSCLIISFCFGDEKLFDFHEIQLKDVK